MEIQKADFGGFPAQSWALLKSEPIGGKAGLKVSPFSCGKFAELMLLPPPVWLAQGRSPFWALITLVTEIDNPLNTVTHTGQLPPDSYGGGWSHTPLQSTDSSTVDR